jgi:hypothetical protein
VYGYLSGVTSRPHMRRCAALIAAYALALQAIFSAFVSPSRALTAGFEICTGGADADRAHEPAHASCSACLAGHCAGGVAGPLRNASAQPWPRVALAPRPDLRAAAVPPSAGRHEPHAPRAPPPP